MSAKIIPKKSSVASKIPTSASLEVGEIAINLTDGVIYSKDGSGTVVNLSGAPELHTHSISQITNLQTALNSKVDSGGAATLSDVNVDSLDTGHSVLMSSTATVATTTQTPITEFPATTYTSAKFIIQATAGNDRQVTELLVIHDGTVPYATEYGTISTANLFSLEVDIDSGDVRLLTTNTSATSTVFKISETLIRS